MDKGGGDNGGAGGAVDDMGESMQCSNHPYKTNPGGICAFCLQEKLGKLLSSSQSNASFFPSSASPSFRSDNGGGGNGNGNGNGVLGGLSFGNNTSSSSSIPSSSTSSAKKKLKKVVASNNNNTNLVLMRSKSSSSGPVPIRRNPHHHHHHHLFDGDEYTPRKGGFWSFLHISSRKHHRDYKTKGESKPSVHPATINTHTPAVKEKSLGVGESSSSRKGDYGDENESPNSSHASSSSFGRKVARSRSVGCGSRSFSGDLLERISTGFGDCTLRRVESQREAKQPKGVGMRGGGRGMGEHHHRIKERVKCGGIFGGFSSSSSSSSHWASSSEEVNQSNESRRDVVGGIEHRPNSIQPHSRHKSWGWAFASPMRAFKSSKPEEKIVANGNAVTVTNNANAPAPNLAAIPSLLTVRS